jgi:hypothetical protein
MVARLALWVRAKIQSLIFVAVISTAVLLSGCMMAAAPLLGAGSDKDHQESSGQAASGDEQAAVAVFYPEDAKLNCEEAGRQLSLLWRRLAAAEVTVRGESPLAITRKSERPRLESLQKRYNRLIELARQRECSDWKEYGPMVVGETAGTERVGEAAQKSSSKTIR